MQLRFELGDPQTPRGHAILYARSSDAQGTILATYCIVLPIQFSLGKYLPPMFASQLPGGNLPDSESTSAVPIPPMLEDVPNMESLRQLAERRGDDLCEIGTILLANEGQRMSYAAEACASYAQAYSEYVASWPAIETGESASAQEELNVEDVLAEVLPERDRLNEMARLIGQARYAMEGRDQHVLDEVGRSMRRIARSLPEKYRAELLVEAALHPDEPHARLATLYLERAYKLADEAYTEIPPIEQEIRTLRDSLESGS